MGKGKKIKVIEAHLGQYKADGLAWPADRVIAIDKRLKGVRKLDVYIHEYTHCRFPEMDEETVSKFATHLAKFLFHHHVRFTDAG